MDGAQIDLDVCITLVRGCLGRPPRRIVGGDALVDDLGFDSVARVELMARLEELGFAPDWTAQLEMETLTIDDLVAQLREQRRQGAARGSSPPSSPEGETG